MLTLLQDVRYALRLLRKTPGFTITVILTLALGIGANAAIFTLVHSVLLQNLPVTDPKTLVRLGDEIDCCVNGGAPANGKYSLFSTDTYQQLRKSVPEFADLAAIQAGFAWRPLTVRRDGTQAAARSLSAEFVSGNYFRTFGLQPRVGRLLQDDDDNEGAAGTAVMSYLAWQRDYAGDPSVVGSTFWMNTKPVTVVGIAPEGFFGDRLSSTPPDFYLPMLKMPELANTSYVHNRETQWLYMVGRVKPGLAPGALQDKVNAVLRQALANNRDYVSEEGKRALSKVQAVFTPGGSGIQEMQERYSSRLRLLMCVSGLVLLIACANIANLLLVRGMARRSELSVRTALGAAPGRIIRQLLTESVLLALMGGVAGLLVAYAGAQMLLKLAFPGAQNLPIHGSPSMAVIGFAFGLSLLTGVIFGVLPAWIAAHTQPVDALRGSGRTTIAGAPRLQRGLVVVQAALSLVLLVGAGLFSQSLSKLQSADLKLDATNRYIVHINPQAAGYSPSQVEALYRTIEQRFHTLPGVESVGIATYTPMEDNNSSNMLQIQGRTFDNRGASIVRGNAEFFDSVGTHVLMGRGIAPQDTSTAPAVAVVNESFVKEFFKPEENPIGRRFGEPGPVSSGDLEIVGVVEDTVYSSLYWKKHSMFFVPMTQRPASDSTPIDRDISLYAGALVLHTAVPMDNMETLVRTTLSGINSNLAIVKFQTMNAQIAERFNDERMIARLTMMFGVLALLLATIGLYGVTAYTVERRTPEIGIRMAVGAERKNVIALVMRGAVVQIVLGLAIGIPVAFAAIRFVKSQLYEFTSADPTIILGAMMILTTAACLAGMIPARRAASIDPLQALRSE
ncbi:MAG TPA: ABC transporter permease [Terriglobales bacterium]